ncbi:hypothetical protein MHYP_G00158070 [Metynnis hypsauchen]
MFLPLVTATNQNPELGIANYPCSQEDLSTSSLHPYGRCQQPRKTGVHARARVVRTDGPEREELRSHVCANRGRLPTEGRLAASSTLRQPKEKPQAAESYSAPPFDHRPLTGRPPSSQASSPGRPETEVGYQLRRLACLKPHQDIWDCHWKPECEPTGSQVRFPSLRIQSPVSRPQKAFCHSYVNNMVIRQLPVEDYRPRICMKPRACVGNCLHGSSSWRTQDSIQESLALESEEDFSSSDQSGEDSEEAD